MQSRREAVWSGQFFGHSANADGAGVPELLSERLQRTAKLAARFSAAFKPRNKAMRWGFCTTLGNTRISSYAVCSTHPSRGVTIGRSAPWHC